jgi:hypothetical protein
MDTSNLDVKLKLAIAYLDDRLTTHRASRFRPSHVSILDRWLAERRVDTRRGSEPALAASAASGLTFDAIYERRPLRAAGVSPAPTVSAKGAARYSTLSPAVARLTPCS